MSSRSKAHRIDSRRLGRMAITDLRDHKYALRPTLKLPAGITSRSWPVSGEAWDQGYTSQCVAFSSLRWLTAGPVKNTKGINAAAAPRFYKACQNSDEWPGDDYDGTSVRAAMKVLRAAGYIPEFHWAYDVLTCADFVLRIGPMVFGTQWTEEMFTPDRRGFLTLGEKVVGGHAYPIIGVNTKTKCPDGTRGAFTLLNSWGKGWGINGRAKMPFSVAGPLLKEDGEAACALEIKLAAAPAVWPIVGDAA